MSGFRLNFSSTTLWLLATASLLSLEVCATATRVLPPTMANHCSSIDPFTTTASRIVGEVGTELNADSVLVISNVGPVEDGEIEVTLKAIPISSGHEFASTMALEYCVNSVQKQEADSSTGVRSLPTAETTPRQLERLYFVPTTIPEKHREATYTAVSCRLAAENRSARVYIDQRLPQDESLDELVTAIDQASSSSMVDKLEQLVGLPEDVDGDGHLTIVVTPELDRLGSATTPVRGLTQPNDFVPEIDRPHGNQSDVIYLSSSLKPGEHLNAVIAHEWCHASIFSRHMRRTDDNPGTDEDWFSEAMAHVVEVASSGSDSNIAHRVRNYLSRPAHSPLVVRDYCLPEYWRHDGCRGAGYLFLKWCLEEFPSTNLSELTGDRPLAIQSLESVTHHSFEELFADWTRSLGMRLAADLGSKDSAETPISHHTWKLEGGQEQTVVLRMGGTCADFVHIQCSDPSRWRITVETSTAAKLRTGLLPIHVLEQ